MLNSISNSHCYLWRYRNKDHTFMTWSGVIIWQLYRFGEHYAEVSGKLPGWEPSTRFSWNPDEISVTQNHYYYMWSKELVDDFTVFEKFRSYITLNYTDLISECEKKLKNVRSEKRIDILNKQIIMYEDCIAKANERFDKRTYGMVCFDN